MDAMTRRRLIVGAAVLLLAVAVIALLAYGFGREPRDIESPMFGRPAPTFALTLFDGQTVRLEDFRGKVVFLSFWASWCLPCREEARRSRPHGGVSAIRTSPSWA
jgi:cytochrome c biogenesis protein CcmG, thiol:disulfide interchange protein DsbE